MEDQDFSTAPDPRSRALSPTNGSLTPTRHPDLNDEVATLSTKLINSINHQTTLDDTLSTTRQELEASKEKVRDLEEKVARQQEFLSGDVWVKRKSVEGEKSKLLSRIVEEKKQRTQVEQDKRKIEQELENLTAALFEEANKMVISAKEEAQKDQEVVQRKNDLLKAQLADTEGLLKSQQEQLTQLKVVMEQMTVERDDHSGTTPSSPGFSKFDPRDDDTRVSDTASQSGLTEPFSPTYPTSFTHLLQPVLRTDLSSYEDFLTLVKTSKKAPSRASSGSYSGLNPLLNLASAGSAPSNASTSSLSTAGTASANMSPQTPNTPASAISSTSSSALLPPLKDTKFYKRALAEDIEPTLRLDIAPGLSWLARRSVLTSMTEGTMVVEPVPTNSPFAAISKPQFYSCSLCGENRKDIPHLRMHRFRTSEAESAQRYPLCKYCLSRVRSTCDFLGFLRMVKDGHWRADDAEAERAAWEESVRLREQMFWCRIGGGVIPASQVHAHPGSTSEKSPRPSQDVQSTTTVAQHEVKPDAPSDASADAVATPAVTATATVNDSADEYQKPESSSGTQSDLLPVPETESAGKTTSASPSVENSTQAIQVQSPEFEKDVQRLSITIPGSFDFAE
ncbi:GDP/GTP exchange factor Sec2p [Xylariales sp. AK1849]|nr:GDP/GTP exchange factor Sec2p [Xylariales sp. AK1849]